MDKLQVFQMLEDRIKKCLQEIEDTYVFCDETQKQHKVEALSWEGEHRDILYACHEALALRDVGALTEWVEEYKKGKLEKVPYTP